MKVILIIDFPLLATCLSGKILVLEISKKMFLTNHTAGFFKCNISRKNRGFKLFFCLWVNRVSQKVVLSLIVSVARHAQSIKNNFAVSL